MVTIALCPSTDKRREALIVSLLLIEVIPNCFSDSNKLNIFFAHV